MRIVGTKKRYAIKSYSFGNFNAMCLMTMITPLRYTYVQLLRLFLGLLLDNFFFLHKCFCVQIIRNNNIMNIYLCIDIYIQYGDHFEKGTHTHTLITFLPRSRHM